MEWVFVGITAITALLALGNWRGALYACLVLDALRDPFRKLSEHQSSITTVVVGIVWLAALAAAIHQEQREVRLLPRRYPQLRTSFLALLLALIPGTLVAIVLYNNGWILAVIGTMSYTGPFVGISLGYLWPRRLRDVDRWLSVYTIVNSLFLIGSVLEAMNADIPGLGGLNTMKWIRNYGNDIINLICGFYRSPDVMGLHSAHVIMFATILAARHRKHAWFWITCAAWASISLLLCGRRKMIVIPLIALVVYFILIALFSGRRRVAVTTMILGMACLALLQLFANSFVSENEYTRFASSIASESVERASRSFTDIVLTTLRQSGWLGDGLGTVTQGRQYMGVVTHGKDWQEDGVGRLFKELGVPGVIGVAVSALMLLGSLRTSLYAFPRSHPASTFQFALCGIIAANAASFSVSHQAYSGDPSTVLIVGFCLGLILGLPRPAWDDITRSGQKFASDPVRRIAGPARMQQRTSSSHLGVEIELPERIH